MMAESFGSGVSRTLSALQRQFAAVVWQHGKPPLDSEFNLIAQVDLERAASIVRSQMHSGFLVDPTAARHDFVTNSLWSNLFKLGNIATGETAPPIWANVNGWMIPVTGTATTDASNIIKLYPPPESDARIDFVFLEAWLTNVAPNPSTLNKPSASTIYKYGNVEFGGTNITDDLEDPSIGRETTERLQVQYRIRLYGEGAGLGASVALDDYPDGLDDPNILGQGAATTPVAGLTFTNMREALGDPSLWRAGDGDPDNDLGTYDGYTYAIPIAAVFRRNSDSFVARTSGGNPNQNGAFNRNPSASTLTDPRAGARVLATASLTSAISESTAGAIQVTNLSGSGLEDFSDVFIVIDNEIMRVTAVNSGASTITVLSSGRGRNGTMALPHAAGSTIEFFNSRPDGLFADEIHESDILDLRRSVTAGDWDYQRLLLHNLSQVFQGKLHSSYKQSAVGDTQGPVVVEVDTLLANGATAVPNMTEALDGPDGIRTIFSDAATLQPGVTVMLDDEAPQTSGAVSSFDATATWEIGAGFRPEGFMTSSSGWDNNSVVKLHISGANASSGARSTFRDGSERAVRFVAPYEMWKSDTDTSVGLQHPFTMRFIGHSATDLAAGDEPEEEHPGPVYPLQQFNFEKPFIVLGGLLNTDSQVSGVSLYNDSPASGEYEIELPGLNFDTAGAWFSLDGSEFEDDPTLISKPLLYGRRTLYGMLTKGGTDLTGSSSEVYVVLYGDNTNDANNGVWRVVGAGTAGYTSKDASQNDRLRVEPIRPTGASSAFTLPTSATITAELRSQYMNAEDGDGASSGKASVVVVITDLAGVSGGTTNPWNSANLGSNAISLPLASKAVLSTTLLYHPGRGATARVPDAVHRVALINAGTEYLRQSPTTIDSSFAGQAGVSSGETPFDLAHIGTWNRLSSLGLDGARAPEHGGDVVASSEQSREHECFVDRGSKTIMLRPYQQKLLTLYSNTISDGTLFPASYPAGSGGHTVDAASLFTAGRSSGFALPPEQMPRFGRLDIPYYQGTTGTFMPGINHLFTDTTDPSDPQFYIIGGSDNSTGGDAVYSMRIQTGSSSALDYGEFGPIDGVPTISAYQGRIYNNSNVISSDMGRGMKGIQLPPFLGIARLFGVYDRRDFEAAGGSTFESDRMTPAAGAPANLLRTDATKQTLFIAQGGASDFTENEDDHTYVVPESAIDIRLSSSYVDGEEFEDIEFVVECTVFGFARGWINKNNYVLMRRHNGEGTLFTDGVTSDVELEGVNMTIPAPASLNDEVYVAYTRTVYQGDPFMTRDGATRTVSDYEHRYGQVGVSDAYELVEAIQQYDAAGEQVVETPNRRALYILASADFYTTLGTGKIGGKLFEGTPLDVGHVENTEDASHRVPASASASGWRVLPRAFTAGQNAALEPSYASLDLVVASNAAVTSGDTVQFRLLSGSTVTLTAGTDFSIGSSAVATATNIAAAIAASTAISKEVRAHSDNTSAVRIEALRPGSEGNNIKVEISDATAFSLRVPGSTATRTGAYLHGGKNEPVNAGHGTSPLDLTGMTERLPMGILLQDSDFLCEDPIRDGASAMRANPAVIQPRMSALPLTEGQEFTRIQGGPGEWLGMADGSILAYSPYDATDRPTGTKKFRLYRGGGSAFVLSGPRPGGPVDWTSGSFADALKPVLKGGALVGKAFLVSNFPEEAFAGNDVVSHGSEIQMVIITHGVLGDGDTQVDGVDLEGVISPTGYGEGFAAADRYRLEGKPMVSGAPKQPVPTDVDLAVFPYTILTADDECDC